jgi:hypothetical protein
MSDKRYLGATEDGTKPEDRTPGVTDTTQHKGRSKNHREDQEADGDKGGNLTRSLVI